MRFLREKIFAEKIQAHGGRVYIAGGWVRDKVRGVKAKDKDYVVSGLAEKLFCRLFPPAEKVGKSFPVYLLAVDGKKCEIAFARREKKTGPGYRGFAVFCDATVTIEEDLYRRDTTMNSMAWELPNGRLLDPYDGQADIQKKMIRATSAHFLEDPVRALRAARQAAEMEFSIEAATVMLMRQCRSELAAEPQERFLQELVRALHCPRPSLFFRALQAADLLAITFPEIFALIGKTQPVDVHPEGDAFAHTLQLVDQVAALDCRPLVRFAALVHDLGKGVTPVADLPQHHGHDANGLAVLAAWSARMTFPRPWLAGAVFAIREHMRAPQLNKTGKIVELLLAAEKNPLGLAGFQAIILADNKSLPDYLKQADRYLRAIHAVRAAERPPQLAGKAIGEWLREKQIQAYQRAAGK